MLWVSFFFPRSEAKCHMGNLVAGKRILILTKKSDHHSVCEYYLAPISKWPKASLLPLFPFSITKANPLWNVNPFSICCLIVNKITSSDIGDHVLEGKDWSLSTAVLFNEKLQWLCIPVSKSSSILRLNAARHFVQHSCIVINRNHRICS